MKKGWKRLIIFLSFCLVSLFIFSILLRSESFWRFALKYISASVPGNFDVQTIKFDLETGTIHLKNLTYQRDNKLVLSIESADLNLTYAYVIRGLLGIKNLKVQGFLFYQENLPKKDKPISGRNVLKFLLKHIVIEQGTIDHGYLSMRIGHQITVPHLQFSYRKRIFGNHRSSIQIPQCDYTFKNHHFKIEQFDYEGRTSLSTFGNYKFVLSQAKGKLEIGLLTFDDQVHAKLMGTLFIDGDTIGLTKSAWDANLGKFNLAFLINPEAEDLQVDFKSQTPLATESIPKLSRYIKKLIENFEFDLVAKLHRYKKLENLDGKLYLTLTTHGNSANPADPTQQLNVRGKIDNGSLNLDQFQIKSQETDLVAQGKIDFAKQKFDTKIQAKKINVETLLGYFTDIKVGGQASSEGTIRGDFKNPEFQFKTQAQKAFYSALHFASSSGDLSIKNRQFNYNLQSQTQVGNITFGVKIDELFSKLARRVQLKTTFDRIDIGALLNNPFHKGLASGSYEMEVFSNKTKKGILRVNGSNYYLDRFHFGDLSAEGVLENDQFTIKNVKLVVPQYGEVISPGVAIFQFTPEVGFTMKANPLLGIQIQGKYFYARPQVFETEWDIKNGDLRLLEALLELPQIEAYADAKMKLNLGVGLGSTSTMELTASRFYLPIEEGALREARPLRLNYQSPRLNFADVQLKSEGEILTLQGGFVPEGALDIRLLGKLNLSLLRNMRNYFRDGAGNANVNVAIRGTWENPFLDGSIEFLKSSLAIRRFRGLFENMTGKLIFKNSDLVFENFKANVADGEFKATGHVQLNGLSPAYYNLKFSAQETTIAEPGTYKMVFSGDFDLKGPVDKALLTGTANILDGKYIRNFSIAESVLKAEPAFYAEPGAAGPIDNIGLNLKVRSPGELSVKNNLAQLFLKADLEVYGTVKNPKYKGLLEIIDGYFNYFNVEFENAQGYVDFKDNPQKTYIDMKAERNFERFNDIITVSAHIQGNTENPLLTFRSNPPMDRKDILSLLFTGAFPGDSRLASRSNLASNVLVSQLTTFFEGPVERYTKLDIFRLEANEPEEEQASRLVIGKRLTDRLTLEFKTDLNPDSNLRTVQMEYLLLDNMLIKSSRSTGNRYKLDVTFRWKLY